MRLASLKSGRDGRLVLVAQDQARCAPAEAARTLQAALDDWARLAPRLAAEAAALEAGKAKEVVPFRPEDCAAPLPRAYQWADASAYVNHVELVRRARGAEMPASFWTDPLMYQGGSDGFLGPRDPIPLADEAWGCDFEAEVAVIVDDVPQGISAEAARQHSKLVVLVNDVSLRSLIPGELAKGFGFFQSKPASALSPLALTPDELGEAWAGAKLSLPIEVWRNAALFGRPNAGVDMTFDFGQLIAHAARTRSLGAGSVIGSGTISNKEAAGPGRPVSEGGAGYACIAEQRTVETLQHGQPRTPFLKVGEEVRIEMKDRRGRSLFGAIAQRVERYTPPNAGA